MSTDFAEKERAFVESLAADTGRDLAGWMAAIASCGCSTRNDTIDWLRHQRFSFAKASWLERIHNNGGALIYAGVLAAGPAPVQPDREPARAQPAVAEPAPAPAPPATPRPEPQFDIEISDTLAAAKGLRPLAELIVAELRAAVPGTTFYTEGPLVFAASGGAFAALLPGPKKLKLYADFAADPNRMATAADFVNKAPPPFAKMLVLDDARRIDQAFRDLLAGIAPIEPLQRRA